MNRKKASNNVKLEGLIAILPDFENHGVCKDFVKSISLNADKDISRFRELVRGDTNATIRTIEKIAEAIGYRATLTFVPSNELINEKLKDYAHRGKEAWIVGNLSNESLTRMLLAGFPGIEDSTDFVGNRLMNAMGLVYLTSKSHSKREALYSLINKFINDLEALSNQ